MASPKRSSDFSRFQHLRYGQAIHLQSLNSTQCGARLRRVQPVDVLQCFGTAKVRDKLTDDGPNQGMIAVVKILAKALCIQRCIHGASDISSGGLDAGIGDQEAAKVALSDEIWDRCRDSGSGQGLPGPATVALVPVEEALTDQRQ